MEQLATTSTGWTWTGSPLNACKAAGVATEQIGINSGVITSQYGGSNTTWAQAQSARLKNLFGSSAVVTEQEDFQYITNWSAGMVPPSKDDLMASRMWRNNASSFNVAGNIKGIYATPGTNADNTVCAQPGGSQNGQPDFWDEGPCSAPATNCENAATFLSTCFGSTCTSLQQTPTNTNIWSYQDQEVDNIPGFNKVTHYDMGYAMLSRPPSVTNNSGMTQGGPTAHTYTDATAYWKLRAADLLVTEYECTGNGTTHQGTAAACCTQAGLPTYPGAVCSPFAAASFPGGVNPFGDGYIGASPASDGLTQMNTAWGLTGSTPCTTSPTTLCNSAYTTWGSSSATLTQIQNNGYATACSGGTCHGVGTGFLDENGKRLSNNSCNVAANVSWATTAQIETDSHLLVADQALRYINTMEAAFSTNSLGPTNRPPWEVEAYNPPTYVIQAEAHALNANSDHNAMFWLSPGASVANGSCVFNSTTANSVFNPLISAITTGYSSGYPIEVANFWSGNGVNGVNSDDPLGPTSPCNGDNVGFDDQAVRGGSGTGLVAYYNYLKGLQDSNGHYPVIAFDHLYTYDDASQTAGFGLWTSNDNLLDGSASTNVSSATWNTVCATNHLYTGPAGCKDSNGNYEGFLLTHGGTCMSASSAPSWPTNALASLGKETTNGGCTNIVESISAVPITETSTQVGASGHASEYGNNSAGGVVTPLMNWINAGICDPSSGSTTQRVSGGSMF